MTKSRPGAPGKDRRSRAKGRHGGGKGRHHEDGGRIRAVFRWMAYYAGLTAVWGVIAALAITAWYAYDLPDVDEALAASRRPTVTLLAADGSRLATFGDLYGLPARLGDLPAALPEAVLATEDRRFYRHFGIDPVGLARAAFVNLKAGRVVQGGSTITQQVAKILFLTPERTFKRKVQELLLALWLERKFSKDQIFTVYLNRVYLGAGTYGVEAAARKYFGKPAHHLSTYQAAMLAGLLKAPSRYNPRRHPKRAKDRAIQVLANMVAAGSLTPAQAALAGRQKGAVIAPARHGGARYFADWVMEQVPDYVFPGGMDLTVTTTLDAGLQRLAEKRVAQMLAAAGNKAGVSQAALVAMTPDGAVGAIVGGRDYQASQFNRAVQARRQPGSAFKPFVYLAALEAGLTAATLIADAPLTVDGWSPRNFDGGYRGEVSLRRALAQSINTVAVKVAERAGRERVIRTARRLGLSTDFKPTPSLALGAGEVSLIEMTAAYGAFASGGFAVWAHGIKEIRDGHGRVLYRRRGSGPGRVVNATHAVAMNEMLTAVVASGTGRAARLQRPAAGKTGTSQNFRDAWFIGYTADLVAGVWMGNDDERPMKKVTGGSLPARLWGKFMTAAHAGLPSRPLPGLPATDGPVPGQGFWRNLLAGLAGEGPCAGRPDQAEMSDCEEVVGQALEGP